MNLTKSNGYGLLQIMSAIQNTPTAGRPFLVCTGTNPTYDALSQLFTPDVYGVVRTHATIDSAINAALASGDDTIFVAPGHAETLATASAITADVAGLKIIGLGQGNNRPILTFSATDSTVVASADNVSIKNIIVKPSINAVVSAFVVTGNNCTIDIESQDASATVEFASVMRLDTADGAKVNLKHKGFITGDTNAGLITLDNCKDIEINIDAYGVVTAAGWINFVDVLSSNVSIRGRMYTSGITNFTRDVVDTITGSLWDAIIFDASAGAQVSGGSAAALAADDVATVAADVSTIKGNVGGVDSATNVLGADDADNLFASTNVVANKDGSVLERLEALMDPLGGYDPILGFRVTKTSSMADGAGTDNLFTVTGRCLITHLSGEVTTVIGTTTTMKLRDVTNSVDLCAATTITTDAVGTMYSLTSITGNILNGTGATPVIGSVPNITGALPMPMAIVGDVQAPLTIAHVLDGAGTGAVAWVLYYKPLTSASSIVAAA